MGIQFPTHPQDNWGAQPVHSKKSEDHIDRCPPDHQYNIEKDIQSEEFNLNKVQHQKNEAEDKKKIIDEKISNTEPPVPRELIDKQTNLQKDIDAYGKFEKALQEKLGILKENQNNPDFNPREALAQANKDVNDARDEINKLHPPKPKKPRYPHHQGGGIHLDAPARSADAPARSLDAPARKNPETPFTKDQDYPPDYPGDSTMTDISQKIPR